MIQHRTPYTIHRVSSLNAQEINSLGAHRNTTRSTPKPLISTLDYIIVVVGLTLITAAIYYPLIIDTVNQYQLTH